MTADDQFSEAWSGAVQYRHVGRELERLVRNVYDRSQRDPANPVELKCALEDLLLFLVSPRGRTDANCCAVDGFFAAVGVPAGVPAKFRPVFDDMSGTLHDSVYAPKIASTFESTPEQLLARIRQIVV